MTELEIASERLRIETKLDELTKQYKNLDMEIFHLKERLSILSDKAEHYKKLEEFEKKYTPVR